MLVYFTNLITSTIFNFLSRKLKNIKNKSSKFFEIIGLTIPILVCGLRYNVGTDFENYQIWFFQYLNAPISFEDKDFGFGIMIKIIQLFTVNPQILFIISAIIINILIMLFIKENTDFYDLGYFLFIALYFYYSSFNIMRQWIAISIFLYSLKFIYNKKIIKYLICVALASVFHKTALLTIPIYFVFRMKINLKNLAILIGGLSVVVLQFENIITFAGQLLNLNIEKYLLYFDATSSAGSNGYAYAIMVVVLLCIILLTYKKYMNENKRGKEQILMLILAGIISLVGAGNMIFARLQFYFIPIIIVVIPNILKLIPQRQRQVAYFLVIILGMLYMYRSLLINGGDPLPYQSVFGIK